MGAEAPPGSESGARTQGHPGNLGGLVDSLVRSGIRALRIATRGLRERRVERAGADEEHEQDAHTGNRRTKETKRGGKGDEKSESFVVPMKSGNSPHEDPTEGRDDR